MYKFSSLMISFWVGCIVMGLTYMIFFYDNGNGSGNSAFIVGQVVIGWVGLLRENYLKGQGC